jgi:uncharacterized membrane protein
MIQKIKNFLITTILGGLTVILPITLIIMVFNWIFHKFSEIINPLTSFVMEKSEVQVILADIIVISVILLGCFLIGFLEKTKLGGFLLRQLERFILKQIPGYRFVKETILQLLGSGKNPFSSVALVKLFDGQTRATAFVTDDSGGKYITVFVPTGPNPTSGGIFHVPREAVEKIDIPIELAMKTVISCGYGSKDLISKSKAT